MNDERLAEIVDDLREMKDWDARYSDALEAIEWLLAERERLDEIAASGGNDQGAKLRENEDSSEGGGK